MWIHPGTSSALAAASLVAATCLTAVGCGDDAPQAPGAAGPPNVLLYVVDTLRADGLGIYGNDETSTPSFDAFGEAGVVFENAFSVTAWTRAAMASVMTGLLPWHHGAERRMDRLPSEVASLASHLSAHGYSCALVSSNPNVSPTFGFAESFDSVTELYARRSPGTVKGKELITPSDVVTDSALEWLEQAPSPFCLVVLSIDPHAPYTPPERFDPRRVEPDNPVDGLFRSLNNARNTARDRERIRELYQAEVAFNDESLGTLLKGLEARGAAHNTIAVVTSDHGEEFWEYGRRGHGKSLSEEVLRVPLMVRFPASDRIAAGSRVDRPVGLIDVLPSILDLAGIVVPPDIDGRSLFSSQASSQAHEKPGAAAPPILFSGLMLDELEIYAARRYPWKLVWDRGNDVVTLHDLSRQKPEAADVDPSAHTKADEVRDLLKAALDASLSDAVGTDPSRRSTVEKLPVDLEQSLRALGYLE